MSSAGKPLCLVYEKQGVYECGDAALTLLRSLGGPLGVVAVAGKFRGGKSFLTNRGILRLGPKQGFQTGSTVNACTKGIWLHSTTIEVAGGHRALVLDTEGTGSTDASPQQDAKLLSVAVALASTLVFNSTGTLDESTFAEISVLAQAARALQEGSGTEWAPPSLVWALRDFALQLTDVAGAPITPDQYLEKCIDEGDRADTRALLRSYFSSRSLCPFVRPLTDETRLQKLNTLADKELRPEFLQQLGHFAAMLRSKLGPKRVGGLPADGAALAHLCQSAVRALNDGCVPCVSDTFTFLLEAELRQAVEKHQRSLASGAEELAATLPCDPEQIQLVLPLPPASLSPFPERCARFKEQLESAREGHIVALMRKNDAERTRWTREFLDRASRDATETTFHSFLEEAPCCLGAQQTLETARLVHDVCAEALRAQLQARQRALLASEEAAQRNEEHAAQRGIESERIREELEEALLESAQIRVDDSHAPEMEAERAHSEELLRQLRRCTEAEDVTSRHAQVLEAELAALAEAHEERVSHVPLAAAQELDCCRHELSDLQREVERHRGARTQAEADEAERLRETRDAMLLVVEQGQMRCRQREEECQAVTDQSRDEAQGARIEQERARLVAERASEEAVRHEARALQAENDQAERSREMRRQQTELLAERTKMMREAHELTTSELRRVRERMAESERARMRVEIENESHKRALESNQGDVDQLVKARRYAEDLRDQLHDRESAGRATAALLEDCRKRLASQEDGAREAEATHSALHREKDYKIAMLEVQLTSTQGVAHLPRDLLERSASSLPP